uniref:Uncharacterized protein n=1 Tax=Anguilla anguilla TaxID=7936 RepID=A0A0E9W5S8_ANGAN
MTNAIQNVPPNPSLPYCLPSVRSSSQFHCPKINRSEGKTGLRRSPGSCRTRVGD